MKKVLAISLLCLFINRCEAINRANLNRLEIGMSKGQVLRIMGKPYIREADPVQEWWLYQTEMDSIYTSPSDELTPVVFDKDGKLIGWGMHLWSEGWLRFDVKMDQGQNTQKGG